MSNLRLGSLLFVIIFSPVLSAHEFNPAHLVVDEVAENEYQINWMYPIKNIGREQRLFFLKNVQVSLNLLINRANI